MQPVTQTTDVATGDDPYRPPPSLLARLAPPKMDGPGGLLAALGVNLWVTLLLVPALFLGAHKGLGMKIALALPVVVLAIAVLYRRPTELTLGYPVALLVPIALDERLVMIHAVTPRAFFIVAASLLGYLIGAVLVAALRERPTRSTKERGLGARARMHAPPSDAPPSEQRSELPERWRRRFLAYRLLALLSMCFPVVLLVAANFDPAGQADLRQVYPGRVGSIQALINVLCIALWVGLYAVYFVGPLKQHRTGDKSLLRELTRLGDSPRRPSWLFYVLALLAVASLVLYVSLS